MKIHMAALVAAGLALGTLPARADAPNADQLARIEATLKAAGYVSWSKDIEFDDKMWEVDDARKVANGPECDLKISPDAYQIVETDC